jgi:hypothetical protein
MIFRQLSRDRRALGMSADRSLDFLSRAFLSEIGRHGHLGLMFGTSPSVDLAVHATQWLKSGATNRPPPRQRG